jgi:diguanylate cyclase (GGDEF)-like protein
MGELKRTRDFLINQMESHAQDTATSLGLSLTTLSHNSDIPAMEAMVSALFDRGYYRLIQVRDVKGTLLIDHRSDVSLEQVPTWFIRLIPLPLPAAEALIMDGWRQTGLVNVESHPGYAYQTLWKSTLAAALWFTLTGLIIALLGGIGLHRLLKPLRTIEEQALALCDRQFHIQEQLPRTLEFRRVVTAMNRMTARIRDLFQEQATIADTLLQRTYQDPLTSIGNRRYIEAQIKTKIEEKGYTAKGVFLLFQIQNLQAFNQENGYQAGDQLIKDTAVLMQQSCGDVPEAIFGRLGGGDFAVILPNTDRATAHRIAEIIVEERHPKTTVAPPAVTGSIVCGGVLYEESIPFSQLVTRADTALHTARYKLNNKAVILPLLDEKTTISAGKIEWKELLEHILAHQSIVLYHQPTVSHHDLRQTVHHEVLTRMIDTSGTPLSAGMFIPMAERLGLMPALDRIILEHIFAQPLQQLTPQRIAINLSPLSLTDADFVAWLQQQMARCSAQGISLNFEFPEFRALRYSDVLINFARTLKQQGHALGIDHFGQGLVHFGYLKSLLPDYVKIDRAITNELRDEQSDSYFFINALCSVAHSLDIKVIVEGIETEEQWRMLANLHLDAVQGFYIQRPIPMAA